MEQSRSERRLCALVAVDIAGYSRRAETDEAAAVDAVSRLSEQVVLAAAAERGRVFSTAGDGFMLEFPTVSGALAAAQAIVAASPVPVRAGVHLCEVTASGGGDLLGHGVNVVARLQAVAVPGEIIVSDDARRSARGPLAERLAPVGRVRLAKMKETGALYSLTDDGGARRRLLRLGRWAAAAVAVVVLIGGGVAAWRMAARPATDEGLTTAVKGFRSSGAGGPDAAYGEAVADGLTAALAERHAPVISRDRVRQGDLAGARLVISGDVERDGPLLRVRVQLDDAKAGRVLWSARYERPTGEALALQDQTATNVADVIANVQNIAPDAASARTDVLAAYFTTVDVSLLHRGNSDAVRAAFRRLVALAPDSSRIHALYANTLINGIAYSSASPQMIAQWRAEAKAEASKAVALNPHDDFSYGALLATHPRDDYLGLEALLTKALADNPDSPRLLFAQGNLLKTVGRTAEALSITELSLPMGPPTPSRYTALIFSLAGAGRSEDARALGERQARLMPTSNSIRRANLITALLYASPAEASRAIDRYQAQEPRLGSVAEKAWRAVVGARAGTLSPAAAAAALAAAPRGEYGVDPSAAMSAFAELGVLDLAFAEVERAREGAYEFYIANLFETAGENMRADPRFMPMAAKLGLVDYWTRSGHWPDFCVLPGRPYDCKAVARGLATPR